MHISKVQKSKSAGFTLIELLIVIIIIGILAAIGFVAYSGSQNRAHRADAEATVSQARSKLGEYNAANDRYPDDITEFTDWLKTAEGGNNQDLAGKLDDSGYTYAGTPAGCDGNCNGYTLSAGSPLFNGDTIEVNN